MNDVADTPRISPKLLAGGLICLAASLGASAVLAGDHLHLWSPPGCGEDSPCAAASASAWGRVPGLGWPTAYVGVAYFLGLAAAWIVSWRGGALQPGLRWLVWAGAVVSATLLIAMIAGRYTCVYCVVAHLGNFAFLFLIELAPKAPAGAGGAARVLGAAAAGFAVATGLTLGAQATTSARDEATLAESIEQVQASHEPAGPPFTGRYRLGPENAAIRIVIISDYQCPDCRNIEAQARRVLAEYPSVSLSAKHFPFSTNCNPHVGRNMHPNACWAARAAETAGMLYGNEGFWKMHHWLFDRKGSFTQQELVPGLQELGFEPTEFQRVMQSQAPLELVQADIEEAKSLGLYRTPMVMINGTELRGWWARPNALVETVKAIAAANPPPGDASEDRPVLAREKYIGDWAAGRMFTFGSDPTPRRMGPADAKVEIVVWGDLSEPNTGLVDASVQQIVASRGDTSYTFLHYPLSKSCNAAMPADAIVERPESCRAARAAEAAGFVGGDDAYWAMHRWLLDHVQGFTDVELQSAAVEMGLDLAPFMAAMNGPEVAGSITADALGGKQINITSVPLVFVDRRHVPRWRHEGESLLPDIAARAAD